MLRMLIVLHTMEHIYRSPRYPYALLPGGQYFPPTEIHYSYLILTPLDQNPERNPELVSSKYYSFKLCMHILNNQFKYIS